MTDDDAEVPAAGYRPLFVTDAELIRRIGVPEKIARVAIRALDANPKSGFPKKQKLWGITVRVAARTRNGETCEMVS